MTTHDQHVMKGVTRKGKNMIERIGTNNRISCAVKHGNIVYLCGQLGEGKDITEQTRNCLANLDAVLHEAGSSKEHILNCTIWLKNMEDFDGMNAVWEEWLPRGHAPARATGEVRASSDEFLIEVIVIAALAD